jgi:hypothetical protein
MGEVGIDEGDSFNSFNHCPGVKTTYTSTGVRAPWVTEQQIAPARANLEYNWIPLSFSGVLATAFGTTASTLAEPVEVLAADMTGMWEGRLGDGAGVEMYGVQRLRR